MSFSCGCLQECSDNLQLLLVSWEYYLHSTTSFLLPFCSSSSSSLPFTPSHRRTLKHATSQCAMTVAALSSPSQHSQRSLTLLAPLREATRTKPMVRRKDSVAMTNLSPATHSGHETLQLLRYRRRLQIQHTDPVQPRITQYSQLTMLPGEDRPMPTHTTTTLQSLTHTMRKAVAMSTIQDTTSRLGTKTATTTMDIK